MISAKIIGLPDLLSTLKALPPEVVSAKGGPIRSALRKAASVIQKEAQANVDRIAVEPETNESTGALKKSITIKRRRPKFKGEKMTIGISKVKAAYANTRTNRRKGLVGQSYEQLPPTYYAWFLEFGTEKMKAHPFLRPAWESKQQEALATFFDSFAKGIDAAVKRAKRKGIMT